MKAFAALVIVVAAIAVAPAASAQTRFAVWERNTAPQLTMGEFGGAGASSADASGPRIRTEPAVGCLLGFGHWKCPASTVSPWNWCGERYEQRGVYDCPEGPLEKVDYLGTSAAGAEVYEAQYRHRDTTIIVEPPGPDGKAWVRFKRGNPNGILSPALADVPSPTAHAVPMYRGVY
jgi:hypothetical protein